MPARLSPALDAYIRFENTQSGYRISQERPLVRKLREVCKGMKIPWETQDFRSHSDGNVLWGAGVDPIIFGPGRLETAHTPEESVNLQPGGPGGAALPEFRAGALTQGVIKVINCGVNWLIIYQVMKISVREGIIIMSKSEDGLKAAFAGESQANRTYLAFAEAADKEGLCAGGEDVPGGGGSGDRTCH